MTWNADAEISAQRPLPSLLSFLSSRSAQQHLVRTEKEKETQRRPQATWR